MARGTMARVMVGFLASMAILAPSSRGDAAVGDEVPAAFRPFGHFVGAWKGMAIPAANRLRGWPEKHAWAWAFADGRPVGLTVAIEGGQVLDRGRLDFDPASRRYRLAGTDPSGQAVAFEGPLDESTRTLVLDRVGPPAPDGAAERLTIRPNANMIRYTMTLERQERGAPQFSRAIDANLGKEGETFAAGGAASDLPECILTGGAATMTVAYQGKSYPICCSGCRDEFLADPEKYVKKAALRADSADASDSKPKPARSRLSGDDAFDGLLSPTPSASAPARPTPSSPAPKPEAEPASPPPATEADLAAKAAAGATRAASLLRSAQSLEKLGKRPQALDFYREVVSGYPDTPSAKTAKARIKALED